MKDVFSNYKFIPAIDITDFDTDFEGDVLDVSAYKGIALAVLRVREDASQANTEKLDVTIHAVASDSETPDSGNQIAAFAQIVGANDSEAQLDDQVIAVNLDLVDTQYIQFNFTETNTYEGWIDAFVILGGASHLPIQ